MTEIIHNYTINKYCHQNKILLSNITDFNDIIRYDPASLVYQHSILQHYIFCDVSRQGVCTFGGFFHQPCKMYWDFDMYLNVSHTLERYDKAVVGFCYHPQFGHVLQDMIGAIIAVPTEIIKDAHIFVRSEENQIKQFMKILGFEPERVHALKEEWIFVRDLYVSVTAYGVSGLQVSFKEMHDIIYRNNNLTNIKPTVHIFINKNNMNWGYVKNMDELFNLSKKFYPQYEWIQISPNFVFNVSETMKLFARTKIFVSATGSCSFNMIFLHPNCGVLLIDSTICNCPCIAIAHTLDIWFYYCASPNIKRDGRRGGDLDKNVFNKTLYMVLTAAYKGEWPKEKENSISFINFNMNKVKKRIFSGEYENCTTVIEYALKFSKYSIDGIFPKLQDYFGNSPYFVDLIPPSRYVMYGRVHTRNKETKRKYD